jgi:transposase-like protein
MPLESDAGYICPACSEQNYVAVDPSGGRRQRFVEDCPVCCRPLLFQTEIDRDGDAIVVSVENES